ncbi:hypothetical protein GW931_01065 [archaeon]|nr:hypothetical protein [archaeon]PJC45322.1 MAG: hypothetical protein CO037_02075 [Candidatus Pacearchaeota archaeon CG_4_9_14_0_2_um_filter_30_8]
MKNNKKKKFRKFDFTLILFAILIVFGTIVGVYAIASNGNSLNKNSENTCNLFQSQINNFEKIYGNNFFSEGDRICFVPSGIGEIKCFSSLPKDYTSEMSCGK